MMKNTTDFAKNIELFLTDYLPYQRNYQPNTILAYKDTLKIFVRFLVNEKSVDINKFNMSDLTKELVIEFLKYIRKTSSISSANQRLSILKSFVSYCKLENIELMFSLQSIENIKVIKYEKKEVEYLDEECTKLLINKPDINNRVGLRHKVVMCVLYETGARVQELCDLKIKDINLNGAATIHLHGKGNKDRLVPVSIELIELIKVYINKEFSNAYNNDNYLIRNKNGLKMNRDGVDYILKKYYKEIKKEINNKCPENIYPHMLRHSKAVHMVGANIPMVYIRDFLGHESVSTTEIYAKVDTKLKEKAINKLAPKIIQSNLSYPDWSKDYDLMNFLNSFK